LTVSPVYFELDHRWLSRVKIESRGRGGFRLAVSYTLYERIFRLCRRSGYDLRVFTLQEVKTAGAWRSKQMDGVLRAPRKNSIERDKNGITLFRHR